MGSLLAGTLLSALLLAADENSGTELPGGPPEKDSDVPEGQEELIRQLSEMSLDELTEVRTDKVLGAARHEQDIADAPASITVITDEDIRIYGYRTLADILASVPGVFVTNDRDLYHFGIRGFNRPGDYNTRVLLLIDGHRMNDPIFGTAYIGPEMILDPNLISRVEIIRGPGSAVYGSSAFFAVINVITRKGRELAGAEASVAAGSFDTYKVRGTYGRLWDQGPEAIASASYFQRRGQSYRYPEYEDLNGGIAYDHDRDESYNFLGGISFKGFTLQGAADSREKEIPTGAFGTVFNSRETEVTDTQGYVDLKWEREIEDLFVVGLRTAYDEFREKGIYEYDDSADGGPSSVLNIDSMLGRRWSGGAFVSTEKVPRNRISAGIEFQYDFQQDQENYDRYPSASYLDDRRSTTNWGVYLLDELKVIDELRFDLGVRFDHYETFGDTVNPRLGLIARPFPLTNLKLIYGTAFRAPSAYELYYSDGGLSSMPNPDLDAEKIRTYEAVLEQKIGKTFLACLSLYRYEIDGLIGQVDEGGLIQFQNGEDVTGNGLELSLDARFPSGLRGRASWALQRTEDEDGMELTNSPRHLAKLNLCLPILPEKVFAGIEFQYTSPRLTLTGRRTDDVFLTNLTLYGRELLKGLHVSASVYNVFDQRYGDPGSSEHVQDQIVQDGRSFQFQLVYRF